MKPLAVDSVHVYEVRPCKDRRGTDLISDVLPFGQFFMADQTLPSTQLVIHNITADHMTS